jgi:paraquat-inducible protein B
MTKRANSKLIGAFIIGAMALGAGALLVLARGTFFEQTVPVAMFFDGDVNGLPAGAPIAFRGVKVGQITRIHIQVGSGGKIAVYGRFERKQLPGPDPQRVLQELVQKGLRAQLAEQSLVTGQLYVGLNLLPSTPARQFGFDATAFEIPTVPSELQLVTQRGTQLLAKLESVDFPRLVDTVAAAAEGIKAGVHSPQLTAALRSVSAFFVDADKLARQAGPLLASFKETSDSLRATSDTSRQLVADTAQEVRALADSLTRTSDSAQGFLVEGQQLFQDVHAKVDPLAASVMNMSEEVKVASERAQEMLGGVNGALTEESPLGQQMREAIRELTGASRSLRVLASFLEEHPEAVVWGRRRGGP